LFLTAIKSVLVRQEAWSSGRKIHVQEVVGSNPAVYWMDVSDASYYIYIEKKKNKGSQIGHTKKYFFLSVLVLYKSLKK
jgi:hypothetical protein